MAQMEVSFCCRIGSLFKKSVCIRVHLWLLIIISHGWAQMATDKRMGLLLNIKYPRTSAQISGCFILRNVSCYWGLVMLWMNFGVK